jgi:hypothetical protein
MGRSVGLDNLAPGWRRQVRRRGFVQAPGTDLREMGIDPVVTVIVVYVAPVSGHFGEGQWIREALIVREERSLPSRAVSNSSSSVRPAGDR